MQWIDGIEIFNLIKDNIDENDEDMVELYQDMINDAIKYAVIRTEWMVSDRQKRNEMDKVRTSLHNSFISSCSALSRFMKDRIGYSWMDKIGADRKDIGDFACYIHCILGIQAR